MRCYLILLLIGLGPAVSLADDPPRPSHVPMTQIRRWVAELDHDDFFLREKAAAGLATAGSRAINPLADAVLSENPEVAWRASEVLEQMALEGDSSTVDRIVRVLNDLAKRGKPGLAQIASEMRERQKTLRHSRAVAALRKLGGQVGNPVTDGGVAFAGGGGMIGAIILDAGAIEVETEPVPEEDAKAAEADEPEPGEAGKIAAAEPAPAKAPVVGLRLPELEERPMLVADVEDIFPGDDLILAGDDAEPEDAPADAAFAAVAAAPPLFVAGVSPASEDDMPVGSMRLTSEWRGGDEGLKHLKDLYRMATVQIEHADLTDAALPHIARMPDLTYLQIRGGRFSREALRAFHRQRPKVSIMSLGEGMMGVNGSYTSETCVLDTVFPGSGAADAGLQAGDEILSIAGEEVGSFSDLTISVSTCKPNEKLKVVYKRDGQRHETEVTIKPRPPGQ